MSQADNPYYANNFLAVAQATENERAAFITKTYLHLAGAIGAFALLVSVLLSLPMTPGLIESVFSVRYGAMMMFGGFMLVSWIANKWAHSSTSLSKQYLGLGLYVVAEAIFMVPMLYFAKTYYTGVIGMAGATTLGLFGVLTTVVFITRKDFSFMRSALMFGGTAAFGLIACSFFFSFALGPIFTYAMIALACCYILYDTSNVMLHYQTTQYVAASLSLFASVALLFWYVLQMFMSRD